MYSAQPLTDRAVLRPLLPWHADEFLAHLDRAREHIAPWVGQSFVAVDLESATAVLQRYADGHAKHGGGIHGIWLDGTLVGGVMVVHLDTATGICELGCWLEPAAVGRGLITKAAAKLLDWVVRERGVQRVEWQTVAGNEPSNRVAQRLGMRLDGVMRSAVPGRSGSTERKDLQIWSILADEWFARTPQAEPDRAAIDALAAAFFGAFGNLGGAAPDVASLRDLFLPTGVVVKAGPDQQIYDLDGFIEPRQALLTGGELVEFHEWETSEQTVISGDVAQRFSRYAKAGVLRGEPFTGTGAKSMQCVRTPAGWRIVAVTWSDDTP
ncbi:RimJ/RimL family protein N-acetyltransferase [Allocatelliglobosispora scoriae]|uniref:RimJ/RimL family protein N-acetyltransferase n=1 Tax=Allocatelliglobosispora scoriae TaxID=643052 RepID=A0A841BYJ1_9ACTN|nr:RimJ/RimL family protein N-acetyltransferase [Allocatelliglobosispora scoriae]